MKLIFLHGSGSCGEAWRYQVRFFENADAVDLPGHPEGEPCTSVDDYVEWLRRYIQQRAYTNVVLIGHSLGGAICFLYALKYPDDLRGIVSVGSGARLRVHPMYLEELERAIGEPARFAKFQDIGWEHVDPDLAGVVKTRSIENGPRVMLNDLRACDEFDIMKRLSEISVPTLAICGSDDIMTPPKYSHHLAEQLPNARTVVIQGGTHMVFAEKPEEVNSAITEFLGEL